MSTVIPQPLEQARDAPGERPHLEHLLGIARELLAASSAHVRLSDGSLAASCAEASERLRRAARDDAAVAEACARVLAEGHPVAAPDLAEGSWAAGRRRAGALLGVPLRGEGEAEAVGCLFVLHECARIWSAEDHRRLADVAVLVAREVRLQQETLERRALENVVRTLGTAVENMQLGVTVTDLNGRIVYTNPAEARMHGYSVEELVGQHARMLGAPELCRDMFGHPALAASSWTRESINVRRDGSRFPVLLWSDRVADSHGRCIGVVTCCEDVTERKRSEQALRDMALRDPLTGLPNRPFFLDRLTEALAARHEGRSRACAVLFLDLDRFKVVNDSLGHHVGDELLRVIADRLRQCVRPADTVARFGGDEFAVLLLDLEHEQAAVRTAERIQQELARPVRLHGYEFFTSASIGIVLSSAGLEQPEHLWRSADMAMYRAKAQGVGRYEVFDQAMHADALARLELETDLRRALDRDELRLHYQPVVELDRGRVVGFEALLRWDHPGRGLVPPQEFVPVAEEMGLILPIGEWVLRAACRQIAEWRAGHDAELWVGVNLSGKQLSQASLPDQVAAALDAAGLPGRALKLEITESAVVDNSQGAADALQTLRSLGVQLYMDDFGTGYSSLSYLHRLPLNALKIDRSFVDRMQLGGEHAQLVATIVSLAQGLRLQVVAEGVTSPCQIAMLRSLGCELAQGFLFSPPVPPGEVAPLLESPRSW